MKLRRSQMKTLASFSDKASLDSSEIAMHLRITTRSAQRRLDGLTAGPGFPPVERIWPSDRYRLTPTGKELLEQQGGEG